MKKILIKILLAVTLVSSGLIATTEVANAGYCRGGFYDRAGYWHPGRCWYGGGPGYWRPGWGFGWGGPRYYHRYYY